MLGLDKRTSQGDVHGGCEENEERVDSDPGKQRLCTVDLPCTTAITTALEPCSIPQIASNFQNSEPKFNFTGIYPEQIVVKIVTDTIVHMKTLEQQ